MVSQLRGVINFFQDVGIYDVVLPFLLVFTIVFAILEKTKALGVDTIDGKTYTKKNLNSMIAFVIAFFVVASVRLVAIISETMSNIVLLILLAVSFLMLVGVFLGSEEFSLKDRTLYGGWLIFFMVFMTLAIFLIFLHAIRTEEGVTWLDVIWAWLVQNANSQILGSIVLIGIIIGFMFFVTRESKKAT